MFSKFLSRKLVKLIEFISAKVLLIVGKQDFFSFNKKINGSITCSPWTLEKYIHLS